MGIVSRHVRYAAVLAVGMLTAYVEGEGNSYKEHDVINVHINTVGPYYNPSETYPYYRLPVCRPAVIHSVSSLGENLDGDMLVNSLYDLKFKDNIESAELCPMKLKPNDVEQLKSAIEELYYFEFYLDDIPMSNFIGYLEEKKDVYPHTHKVLVYSHYHFNIYYNQDKVIFANISVSKPKVLPDFDPKSVADIILPFTYGVTWSETKVEWSERRQTTVDLKVHWLSIINSIVLVILMTGFVALILMRVLHNDFARYSREETDMEGLQDDYGWKLVSGDVFRYPPHRNALCAILGVGSQFLAVTSSLCLMAVFGVFHAHQHGHINYSSVLLYAFTSSVAGYVSSNLYKQLGGTQWVRNIIVTSLAFI
eukprot:Ihof_evm3s321 gene=Ihof_evmTU3s321